MRTSDDILRDRAVLITIGHDGGSHVLGRPDRGIFVTVPKPGAVFIAALQRGSGMAVAVREASSAAGCDIDGEEFLADLVAEGLFPAEDERIDPKPRSPEAVRSSFSRAWVRRWGGAAFGRPAWFGYGAAAAFVLGVLVMDPDLRPHWRDAWFLGEPLLSLLTFLPLALAIAATHEAGHWLAGRAMGVDARFRVSQRALYLVFETDLTPLVALPRRQRYGVLLAGMAWDVVLLAGALSLRLIHDVGIVILPEIVDRILATLALNQCVVLTWQWAALFLRTDGYAVLANALRCHNLYRATWLTVRSLVPFGGGSDRHELARISAHDRRAARGFALCWVVGMAVLSAWTIVLVIPAGLDLGRAVAHDLSTSPALSWTFVLSILGLAYLFVRVFAPPALALRERRLRLRGRLM